MLPSSRVLQHLAGSIIRRLVSCGISLKSFSEVLDDDTLFAKFPKGQYQDSQWIMSFEDFIEGLPMEHDGR